MKRTLILSLLMLYSLVSFSQSVSYNVGVYGSWAYQKKAVQEFNFGRGGKGFSPSSYQTENIGLDINFLLHKNIQIGTGIGYAFRRNTEYVAFLYSAVEDAPANLFQTWNYYNIPFRVRLLYKGLVFTSQVNNYFSPKRATRIEALHAVNEEYLVPLYINEVPYRSHAVAFEIAYELAVPRTPLKIVPFIGYDIMFYKYQTANIKIPNAFLLGIKVQSKDFDIGNK